jgi:uncharacterized protein involved in cysteine biosynthesis
MTRAFLLSLGQLGDAAVLRVFVKSLAATLGVFAVAGFALWYAMQALLAHWIGWGATGLATAFAAVATVLALWLLFRAVAVAVIGLFADEVVAAVERRHYPAALASARPVPFARGLAMGLRSAARVIAVNLILLPLYVVLLATGVGTAAAFLIVNGWLLGRDLGDMVAARHLDRVGMVAWRRDTKGQRFLLGLADATLFLIPFVNLAAPVLGAAMATHLFHGRRR